MALCADLQLSLSSAEMDRTPLERQLGRACTGGLSRLFRTPSDLPPLPFLEGAERELRLAAGRLRLDQPQKLRLYLAVLGPDCRQTAVPALSIVGRSFYHCMQGLDPRRKIQTDIVCIYPWDTVHICQFGENCIHGLSPLEQGYSARRRRVPLGGLLDCLNRELERDLDQGVTPLVYYVVIPDSADDITPLRCMDVFLIQELSQKHEMGIFEAFLCSASLREKVDHTNPKYRNLVPENKNISITDLDAEMYSSLSRLLSTPRYFYTPAPDEAQAFPA